MKIVECSTDVLVIGGGLAGLMAALSARKSGRQVAIISKGPVGRSGNTLVSGGGISSATHEPGNAPDVYFADIQRSAKALNNPHLSHKLASQSPSMLSILENYGVQLIRQNGGYKRRQPPGHSVPRNIPTNWTGISYLNRGLSFTLPLREQAIRQHIDIHEGLRVIRLDQADGQVIGATAVDRENTQYHFQAGSVILATGGGGHLYQRTNNTSDITGDGLALALQAGCTLQDMEQVQFYPTMMFSPIKVPISNPLLGAGAVLRNRNGEMFMQRYDAAGNMATRDSMARAIFMEIQSGNGADGSVWFDCTQIPSENLKAVFSDFYSFILSRGLDPAKDYLPVSPCVHYFLGGIRIDDACRTGVPGLYAAGEICGGIHGANRLSGAALMEACVLGWQAGETAVADLPPSNKKVVSSPICLNAFDTTPTHSQLKKLMWDQVSLIRDRDGLQSVLTYIEQIRNPHSGYEIGYPLIFMAMVAEAITKSALLRQESRGAHYRRDYPNRDDMYNGHVLCNIINNHVEVRFEPAT